MVQACMESRREEKVVCVGKRPMYVADISTQKMGRSFSRAPHKALFSFVRSALEALEARQPHSILDGLVRVDVFMSMAGMVVNEFESLEAAYSSKKIENELEVGSFLIEYWKLQLNRFLH